MPARVTHSLLDPYVTTPARAWYPRLRLPRRLPPEAIVLFGNASAAGAAACLAASPGRPWAGLLGAGLVLLYHFADVFDGQHARATGQCRNGGELLDHFCDPVSLSLLCAGWARAGGAFEWSAAAAILVMGKGLLENLKAKLGANFEVGRFGPTELKFAFAGLLAATAAMPADTARAMLFWTFAAALAVAWLAFPLEIAAAVRAVNRSGHEADTSEWEAGT